jgi:hypothetical protein
MNWFKLLSVLITVGKVAADMFVKNEHSKKVKDAAFTVIEGMVEGVANQNPDGTPASTSYQGPVAKVE